MAISLAKLLVVSKLSIAASGRTGLFGASRFRFLIGVEFSRVAFGPFLALCDDVVLLLDT